MSSSLVHRRGLVLPLLAAAVLALVACEDDTRATGAIPLDVTEITDVGFANPAAVIVDPVADVYLVSNVNGPEGDRSGGGFISRLSPEGEVIELRWIDPVGEQALDSPQGMAIRGDSLFVADLECVLIFHRETGEDLGYTCLDGVTHVTDVDVGPEGSIFVVDSGLEYREGEIVETGTDAVYRLVLGEGGRGSTLARSADLGHPRGIAVGSRGIFVTTSGSGEIFRLTPTGDRTDLLPPSERRIDGIVFLPDGGFAFASRGEEAIYLVTGQGQLVRLFEGVNEPGGIGFDPARNRIIVPLTSQGDILFLDLPADAEPA